MIVARVARSTPSAYSRAQNIVLSRQRDRNAYGCWVVGELKHRLTVRLGDAHVAQLNALADASGLSRNDVVRRVLLSHQLPTAESLQDIEKLQKLQADQNRLGGLLKKTLTEHGDKADIRRTLAEIERTSARIRDAIDRLAQPG